MTDAAGCCRWLVAGVMRSISILYIELPSILYLRFTSQTQSLAYLDFQMQAEGHGSRQAERAEMILLSTRDCEMSVLMRKERTSEGGTNVDGVQLDGERLFNDVPTCSFQCACFRASALANAFPRAGALTM